MLVLTRQRHETIVIGELGEVQVHVLAMDEHHVRLGIEAPKDIPVDRLEVFIRKGLEKSVARRVSHHVKHVSA